jgi:hypothetical protein
MRISVYPNPKCEFQFTAARMIISVYPNPKCEFQFTSARDNFSLPKSKVSISVYLGERVGLYELPGLID